MPALKNARHEKFCQIYLRGEHAGNARACYKVAYGRDDRQAASRVRQRDDILRRIADIQAEMSSVEAAAIAQATEKLGVSKEWVLQHLIENVERSMQRVAVLDDEGEPVGEWTYDGAVANKALELLGKHLAMFVSAGDHSLNVNVGVQFVDRPPPETHEQWEARRRQELLPRSGDGKLHS